MRQLSKWKEGVDWAKVRRDLEDRIRAMIPSWIADEAVRWAMVIVDVVEAVLQAKADIDAILQHLANSEFQEAWARLRQLILDNFVPTTREQMIVCEMVKDCETCELV
jgi:hypothetical protein